VFPNESTGVAALHRLQAAGCKASWLGVSRTIDDGKSNDHKSVKVIVHDTGGNWAEHALRRFFGRFEDSLYDALIDHGVRSDVAHTVVREPRRETVVVVANRPEDRSGAARMLEDAGGTVVQD
jgi:hypothetical protein